MKEIDIEEDFSWISRWDKDWNYSKKTNTTEYDRITNTTEYDRIKWVIVKRVNYSSSARYRW